VKRMFDRIAPVYDVMNRVMTMGLDRKWRRLTVESVVQPGFRVLDACCGTGDLALAAEREGGIVTGLDFSAEMLVRARRKSETIEWVEGDALALPFPDGSFDAATVGFGVRNVADLEAGLTELRRVLRPGGRLAILEITQPRGPLKPFFSLWFDRIVPLLGRILPGGKAYTYLPASVRRFPGAEETFAIEGLMRDRKALQSGTSHFLGQNFAHAYDVTFLGRDGEQHYAYATSWGVSTRLVGGLIMAHGDDKGLRLPPAVAPVQVVIVPIFRSDDEQGRVLGAANTMAEEWRATGVRVKVDDRDDLRPGYKFADHELRGVPIRIEIGPRDLDASQVTVARRDTGEKSTLGVDAVAGALGPLLEEIQRGLYDDAVAFREAHMTRVSSYDELRSAIDDPGGFVVGAWCGDPECEARVKAETKATIRFVPLEPEDPGAPCVVCGRPGVDTATWALAY